MPSSRWDRPRPPRDWRWVVGGVGKVLIATGLLMFGFVAYQLWGTGLEYSQAQDRLEDDFAALLADGSATVPTSATTAPAPSTAPQVTSGAAPDTAPAPAPTTSAPPVTAAPAAAPLPAAGDVIARIEIPSIGLETYVVSGVQPGDLKKGPGHYPDTPQPGQLGNAAIAGHRTTYGQPFFELDKVVPGDEIVITTVQGRFDYRATGSEVVAPDRGDVVATTDPAVARLTLTTCDPKYTARNRLVLYADLDLQASSAPPQAPIIQTSPSVASTVPVLPGGTDDPVVTAPSTTGTAAPTTGTAAATTTAPTTAAAPTPTTGAAGPSAGSDDELADAFAHGWFSDDAAFPQVALWGALVTVIALAAWMLSRRVRRNWVGALVGIVPFVLALYFFFQNVNRLLPAAL